MGFDTIDISLVVNFFFTPEKWDLDLMLDYKGALGLSKWPHTIHKP